MVLAASGIYWVLPGSFFSNFFNIFQFFTDVFWLEPEIPAVRAGGIFSFVFRCRRLVFRLVQGDAEEFADCHLVLVCTGLYRVLVGFFLLLRDGSLQRGRAWKGTLSLQVLDVPFPFYRVAKATGKVARTNGRLEKTPSCPFSFFIVRSSFVLFCFGHHCLVSAVPQRPLPTTRFSLSAKYEMDQWSP